MSSSIGQPQQHRQPSRKGKRAWRKNVDVTDVQDGLEKLREEIRQGGPLSEKPSDELFVVDTAGSEEIRKKHKIHKPLKVDEILAQRSQVPAVDSRKRSSRTTDGVIEPSSKRQKKDWVGKKEVQRIRQGLASQSHLSSERLEDEAGDNLDLWAEQPSAPPAVQDDYIPKAKPKVAPETLRHAPIPMTVSGKPMRSVQSPDAGISYNPTFEAWDDLLNREGEKELEAEKARLEKAKLEAERQARVAASALEADREGDKDYESAWEGFETDNEETGLKQKRPERKTQSQRNKMKRRKEAERLAKHEAAMGKKQKQTEDLINALIKAETGKQLSEQGVDPTEVEYDEEGRLRRRRLGNKSIPEKSLELVLPDELQESLRRLKPEGNLMNDRFRNLLVNGKLESRKAIIQPKKKKVKYTEKWSYKDWPEIKV
jgi:nucleolar protein 53